MNDARDPAIPEPAPAAYAPPAMSPVAPLRRSGIAGIASAIRRRLPVFVGLFALVIAIAVVALAVQVPRYTATAEVVLDTSGGAISRQAGNAAPDRAAQEMLIVRSRRMAAAVAPALRLDDRFLAAQTGPLGRLLRGGAAGAGSPAERQRRIVDRLVEDLAIARLEDTFSLTIGYTATDPGMAAAIANEYAARYSMGGLAGGGGEASPLDRPFARIISRAEPPLAPSSPRWLPTIAAATVIGLLAGLAGALIAERRFSGITGGAEIEQRLGLPHLGSVPTLRSVLPDAASPLEAMVASPMSGFAEAFRGVMMAIRHAGGRGTQVIAITSALPNEGKTTIAACLARSVALGGESVVLLDCDARRRDTSAMFGLADRRPGLIEVLRYEATLDEALVRDAASGAWILPISGPPAEISELLNGAAMLALIEDLKRRFKRVLIDTAPILAISSTRAIATMADLVVMVVRWRATADHAVLAALRLLPNEHVRVGGIVLSQVDIRRQVKFGHGDPTFYYRQYEKYYS